VPAGILSAPRRGRPPSAALSLRAFGSADDASRKEEAPLKNLHSLPCIGSYTRGGRRANFLFEFFIEKLLYHFIVIYKTLEFIYLT